MRSTGDNGIRGCFWREIFRRCGWRFDIRRKAGIKAGDRVEYSVPGRVINITPKLPPDEPQDERENQDPKVREHIRKSHADYLAGRSRPANEFLAELRAELRRKPKKKSPRSG
ncbi:MAG TPA: hypothetical protein VMH05_01330 [Bryobacteraceae bacterium]|nr:hypothetical protein [Bryobacteraceae bacterium]